MKHTLRVFLFLLTLCTVLVACGGATTTTQPAATAAVTATESSAKLGAPSTSFKLTGLVHTPGTFALADLQAFTKVKVTTNTQPLGQHSFGGALLYDVLQKAGIITDSSRKNDILRKTVLVTGTDGYGAAVSLGEVVPKFAGKQVILAYEEDGQPLPQADGFARLIVPGDLFAGRYVSNVAQVSVQAPGPVFTQSAGGPSSSFFLVGQVKAAGKYDMAALQALQTMSATVGGTSYTGVLLNDLLAKAGVVADKKKNGFLRIGVVAIGSDGYSALIVGGEIATKFGNIQVLVAFSANGQPISDDGFARLIVPGDHAMGRFVSNLVELQVVSIAAS